MRRVVIREIYPGCVEYRDPGLYDRTPTASCSRWITCGATLSLTRSRCDNYFVLILTPQAFCLAARSCRVSEATLGERTLPRVTRIGFHRITIVCPAAIACAGIDKPKRLAILLRKNRSFNSRMESPQLYEAIW